MTLRDLAPNDPGELQYQLWIVDGGREGAPLDGGVFDVPPGVDEHRVIIDAKLPVIGQPKAFVITVERPGGEVVSERARDAMLALPGE